MAEKIVVPVEIGGPEAVRSVRALTAEVGKLEKSVDKLSDKADKADKSMEDLGEKGGVSLRGLAGAFGATVTAAGAFAAAAVAAGHAAAEQAAQGERTQAALRGLGTAYDSIQQATAGTVTAQEAFAAQQRIVRAGLRISGQELTVVTRYAREYARATGTETTQALERLSDALVEGSADAFQEFGIRVQEGVSRAQAFEQAMRSMERQQRGQQPVARSLAEDTARLTSAFTDAAQAMALMVTDGLGLQGVISGLADSVRELATDLQDIVRIRREAASGATDLRARQQATEQYLNTFRGARDELLRRGATREQVQALALDPGTLNRLSTEQLRAASERISAAIGTTAGGRRRQIAQAVAGAQRDPFAPSLAGAAGLFGGLDANAPEFGAERARGEIERILREEQRAVQQQLRPPRPGRRAPRDRINAGAETVAPATAAELRAARSALALALIQRAGAEALGQVEGRDTFAAAAQTAFADRARAQRIATARGEMGDTRARRGENEAARISRIAQATTQYAEALREQREAEQAAAVSARESAAALKDRGDEIGRQLREAIDTRLATQITDAQRSMQEATAKLADQGGFFDDLTGAGEVRREELLRAQGESLRSLIRDVDTRIAQAREQGAAESEINALLAQRVGLVSAVSQADRERAAIERERLAPMKAYRDEMVQGLSAVGNAFVESAALALEGEEAFGQALQRQLRAILVSLAKQSAVEALKNTALGVAAFAGGSVPSGLAYLKAAGLWAATGVAAGVGAAAIPRVDAGAAQAGGGTARTPAPAQARAGGGGQESSGPLVLTINVSGAMMNEGVEESIVRALDRAATRGVSPRVLRAGRGM